MPNQDGNSHPSHGCGCDDNPWPVVAHELGHEQPEDKKSYTSHCRSGCIERNQLPRPPSSVQSSSLLLLFFVFIQQRCACREDGRKGQEQPTDRCSILLSDDSRRGRDQATEQETNGKLMPARLFYRGEVEPNPHVVLP